MATDNASWQLEDFVDSLVVELDKTRETLAIKAINKPLSYTVKDLALDLNIFPTYDGDRVSFVTAQPGQQGASKVTIQLGSITDQQVRATSKTPTTGKGDIKIDDIPVDKATKKELRKLGVNSVDDLQQIERKNVDLKQAADTDIDFKALADQIQKARRDQTPPRIGNVSLSLSDAGRPCLVVQGENLAVNPRFPPVAVVNDTLAKVLSSSPRELRIELDRNHRFSHDNELVLTFDRFAVMKVNVRSAPRSV